MKYLILILPFVLCSCESGTYKLSDGKIVHCNAVYSYYGNINLTECDDGIEYRGQMNIQKLR